MMTIDEKTGDCGSITQYIPYSFIDAQGLLAVFSCPAEYTGYNPPPFQVSWARTILLCYEMAFEPMPPEPLVAQITLDH